MKRQKLDNTPISPEITAISEIPAYTSFQCADLPGEIWRNILLYAWSEIDHHSITMTCKAFLEWLLEDKFFVELLPKMHYLPCIAFCRAARYVKSKLKQPIIPRSWNRTQIDYDIYIITHKTYTHLLNLGCELIFTDAPLTKHQALLFSVCHLAEITKVESIPCTTPEYSIATSFRLLNSPKSLVYENHTAWRLLSRNIDAWKISAIDPGYSPCPAEYEECIFSQIHKLVANTESANIHEHQQSKYLKLLRVLWNGCPLVQSSILLLLDRYTTHQYISPIQAQQLLLIVYSATTSSKYINNDTELLYNITRRLYDTKDPQKWYDLMWTILITFHKQDKQPSDEIIRDLNNRHNTIKNNGTFIGEELESLSEWLANTIGIDKCKKWGLELPISMIIATSTTPTELLLCVRTHKTYLSVIDIVPMITSHKVWNTHTKADATALLMYIICMPYYDNVYEYLKLLDQQFLSEPLPSPIHFSNPGPPYLTLMYLIGCRPGYCNITQYTDMINNNYSQIDYITAIGHVVAMWKESLDVFVLLNPNLVVMCIESIKECPDKKPNMSLVVYNLLFSLAERYEIDIFETQTLRCEHCMTKLWQVMAYRQQRQILYVQERPIQQMSP